MIQSFDSYYNDPKISLILNNFSIPHIITCTREYEEFFQTAYEYLEKWSKSLKHMTILNCTILKGIPVWDKIESTLVYFTSKKMFSSESVILDQFICFKNTVTDLIREQCKNEEESKLEDLSASEKWMKCLKCMVKSQYSHFLKMSVFIFNTS